MLAVPTTLAAVARAPREEVIDDAIDVLVEALRRDARVLPALSKAFPMRSQDERDALLEHASVRAVIARVLGSVRERGTRDARLRALAVAPTDPGAEVRDAAIRALTSSGDPAAEPLLAERLRSEPEEFLREEIEQSLHELRVEYPWPRGTHVLCQLHGSVLFGAGTEAERFEVVRLPSRGDAVKARQVRGSGPRFMDGHFGSDAPMITGLRKADKTMARPFGTYMHVMRDEMPRGLRRPRCASSATRSAEGSSRRSAGCATALCATPTSPPGSRAAPWSRLKASTTPTSLGESAVSRN
jgi:hypothetical protein